PTINGFASYAGGSGDDAAYGLAVDAQGASYLAGSTLSANFPTQNGFQSSQQGGQDAFVLKMNPSGTGEVYATYLGSGAADAAYTISVDTSGHAVVGGATAGTTFPTTTGAYQTSVTLSSGMSSGFITKLSATGDALDFSSYLGTGTNASGGVTGVALDSQGAVYVGGLVQGGSPGSF